MSAFFSYYLDHINSYLIGVGLTHSALIMSALSNVTLIGSVGLHSNVLKLPLVLVSLNSKSKTWFCQLALE